MLDGVRYVQYGHGRRSLITDVGFGTFLSPVTVVFVVVVIIIVIGIVAGSWPGCWILCWTKKFSSSSKLSTPRPFLFSADHE